MSGGIDHLVLCVPDLEAGRSFYERIGFCMTPLAYHPFGTANTLAQMQGCFLEVLGVADASLISEHEAYQFSFGAYNRDFLEYAPGLSMLVYEIDDARAAQKAFVRRGLDTYEPFDFSRKATLPDGSEVTVGFSLAFVTHPDMPRSVFFFCQQHAPEHFWKEEYQRHPNTAQSVEEVVMVADDPGRYVEFFEKLHGSDNTRTDDDFVQASTPRGLVTMVTRATFEARFGVQCQVYANEGPRFAAFVVGVSDMKTVRQRLVTSGVPHVARSGSIVIAGADAFGVLIEFKPATDQG
jgi:catechol 2,3-dioxygenase-like lactoylglutathione lyase family enzyme